MAADIPDAITLNSWEEAFQFPIPTVRRAEQELRRDAESNRDKLRSLVGVKYRELLGTAQTIVDMNKDIQQVESTLSSIGRRCNPRAITKKTDHTNDSNNGGSKTVSDGRLLTAHLSLLRNCTNSVVKIIRNRGSIVLAAKLLVISRLLLKALSQSESVPPYVDNLKKSLAALRGTLLSRVKLRLAAVNTTTDRLIEALSTFCLATSSSSNDAVRHFCEVRKHAIGQQIVQDSQKNGILLALKLYLQTLRQTDHLLSGPLAVVLEKLTTQPLLSDPEILRLGELNIDVLKPWILQDIQHFTPWIKYNETPKSERDGQLKTWSKDTFKIFSSQAKLKLEGLCDFGDILDLRRQLLESWLLVQTSTRTHSNLEILEGLQDIINHQLISILRGQSEGLVSLGKEITSIINDIPSVEKINKEKSLLWDPKLASLDFSEGAANFKEEIVNRTLGREANVLKILELYQGWLHAIQTRAGLINGMKSENWEDMVEDDSDEDVIDHINGILREHNPALLEEEHQKSLERGFSSLQDTLSSVLSELSDPQKASKAVFLIRVVREIQSKIPNELFKGNQQHFALEIVPGLHDIVAVDIVSQLSTYMMKLKPCENPLRCPGRTLWEGKPELPVQPSPAAFKLIRKLVLAMDGLGADLWNPGAVLALKREFKKSLNMPLDTGSGDDTDKAKTSSSENGVEEQEPEQSATKSPIERDCQIQYLFDMLYLDNAMGLKAAPTGKSSPAGSGSSTTILEQDLELGEEMMETLRKRSHAYWERTQLLFGLLGC
ncbi:uncharacterized protein GIQ15_00164 [Arthroderma uncinatum]|uniref:uncharacterized protein n=1 Tax=Arthroderma uncinatum TaxID=74035 RepID=UPI00144AAE60|nr:uncharacterized protein GIQ15_00164 [Arthroderma uncinatum]KAF3490647.1 hypothetical protein GIQ15_00164 [Arthroderma uncinatum]